MSNSSEIPKEIQDFLLLNSYKLLEVIANSRFLILKVMPAQGEEAGLLSKSSILKITKLSSGSSMAERNLMRWTQQIQKKVPADAPFGVAPIIDHGVIAQKYYWARMPFVEGKPLAVMDGGISRTPFDKPQTHLPNIIKLMKFVANTPASGLEGIDLRYSRTSRRDKLDLLENLIGWSRPSTPFLSELLQVVNKNYARLSPSTAHGDFTETNIIIDSHSRPILIDAELASGQHYRYYDVVEFYNRLFTRMCRPDIADSFLREYIKTLRSSEKTRFLNNFICLSAQRCIGNFFEIETGTLGKDKQTRIKYATQFAESIVTYKIINIS